MWVVSKNKKRGDYKLKRLLRFFTNFNDTRIWETEIDEIGSNTIIPNLKDIIDLADVLGGEDLYKVKKRCFCYGNNIELIDILVEPLEYGDDLYD